MIKLTAHLKINILTIFIFAFCFVFHYPVIFYITYAVMLLHEAAHTAAALCIGLRIDHIALQPFGVNLRLKNKMVYSLADEIILYISGPLVNAAAAVLSGFLLIRYDNDMLRLFYVSNLMLFIMNLLPAVPLDGGVILRRALTHRMGFKAADKICAVISAVISAAVMALGIYVIIKNNYNFSVLLFALLLAGNIFTQRTKYDADFIGELMFHKNKEKKRVRHLIAGTNDDTRSIAENFCAGSYSVVYVMDENGKIKKTMTETEVIESLLGQQARL